MDDHANAQAQKLVELAHPFGVALGEVVVDRDDVDAASREGVKINRQGCDQCLAFAGFHFGDLAFVQYHSADQLHVKMTHVQHAPSSFADDGESFHEQFVQHFLDHQVAVGFDLLLAVGIGVWLVGDVADTLLDVGAKLFGLGAQLFIRELFDLRFELVDSLDARQHALHFALVPGPENLT